jgi:hypothetical protein
VGGDDAHVTEVEIMKLPAGEVPRRVIQQVAHRQFLGTERLLIGIGLER